MPLLRKCPCLSLSAAVSALLASCFGAGLARAGDLVFLDQFEGPVAIPWVRQNSDFAAGAHFVIEPAIVTATKLTNSNTKLTLFIQLPQNLAPAPYPKWAAVEATGDAVGPSPAVGDCVRVSGTVTLFKGSTDVSAMTWTTATPLDCANGIIVPTIVSLSDIATDTTAAESGNQPGPLSEAYESTLLTVLNTTSLTSAVNGAFAIYDGFSSSTYLSVGGFLYPYSAVVSTHFSAVTGVLEEFDSLTDPVYLILPRSAADVIVGL